MNPAILRDRLRDVVAPVRLKPDTTHASVVVSDASRISVDDVLGGIWRETSSGRSFVVTRRLSPDHEHGGHRMADLAAALRCGSAATLLGPVSANGPFLFFDLETTGLSGGAGTYAFLVGCGWFDADGGFVTEQHLMIDFAGERSMLHVVADELDRAGALVTFNGKSFDAPLLETRYLFHRLESRCRVMPHIDLLHLARRFWGGASELGCSLGVLEDRVLGVRRSNDVPGFEIPARYFQFVRNGDPRPLAGVLDHNRLDLVSLAGLTARAFRLVAAGSGAAVNAREALALGWVYGRAGLNDRAEDAFERTVALSGHGAGDALVKIEALRALALSARRLRRYEAAAAHWRHVLDVPGCPRTVAREAIVALAVHHEHRARDLTVAKMFALRGLELDAEPGRGDATRHRLARIERKMVSERSSLFPSSPPLRPSCGSPTSARQTSS